ICVVTLVILFLWRVEEIAEACSCSPAHPQQAFCNSDVVIRAKVVGKQEVDVGNDIYGNPSSASSMTSNKSRYVDEANVSLCGVSLEHNGKEYLITGTTLTTFKYYAHHLCDFLEPWETLSATQKKSLTQRYEMGCECKITRCTSIPCMISSPAECLWTDWVIEKTVNGGQAKHFACIKRSDDSCAWYRGAALPKKDFLDIEDP
uniref:Metalloproteinase inhibitor 2 n=1 Tax=Cyclopterus lumpus TaxID=8103 RepID=A0A8C2ZU73_CYCLU